LDQGRNKTHFFVIRIVAIPILIGALVLLNPRHSVTFLLLFVLLADVTSLVSGRWRDLMLAVTSLVLGLTIVEIVASYLSPSRACMK